MIHDRPRTSLMHDRSRTFLIHDRSRTSLMHDRSRTPLYIIDLSLPWNIARKGKFTFFSEWLWTTWIFLFLSKTRFVDTGLTNPLKHYQFANTCRFTVNLKLPCFMWYPCLLSMQCYTSETIVYHVYLYWFKFTYPLTQEMLPQAQQSKEHRRGNRFLSAPTSHMTYPLNGRLSISLLVRQIFLTLKT